MDNWKVDLSWSAQAFLDLVWPILKTKIGGQLIPVEISTHIDMATILDIQAGIDAWHVVDGKGLRGLASRVQVCLPPHRPYNTFTVRKSRDTGTETEYAKRLRAIHSNQGWLYPHLTVQAYVTAKNDGRLLSFGITKTKALIEYIETSGKNIHTKRTSNAEFFVVPFDRIALFMYPVIDEQEQKL